MLHIDLIGKYQIYERPVQNENRPVELKFNISLQQIIDIDERNQLLKSNMWLKYSWTDANLVWNEVSTLKFFFKCNKRVSRQNLALLAYKMPSNKSE